MSLKKYKLIKKYPGSLEVGTVITRSPNSISHYSYKEPSIDVTLNYSYVRMNWIPLKDVEDSPEFWQEIIERKPLFRTQDGVDIYDEEGDVFYYVRTKNPNRWNPVWTVLQNNPNKHNIFIYEPKIKTYFSTREKAEEYLLYNKPCLSFQEVYDKYYNFYTTFTNKTSFKDELISLTKTKI